jgi:REP element-mobilizing transposase RayT
MRSPKIFHRRNLPHIQPQGATFFVTYLLHGAMPAPLKEKLLAERESRITKAGRSIVKEDIDKENRRYFKKLDDWLDRIPHAVYWLRDERLAQIVSDNWHYWDRKRIELIAFCIMPNHVHVVFRPFEQDEAGKELFLQHIMETVKKYTARQCNIMLNRTGQPFWQHESYDRVVRNREELYRIISYVLDNPVKAGLCANRRDWKWSYIKEAYNEFM